MLLLLKKFLHLEVTTVMSNFCILSYDLRNTCVLLFQGIPGLKEHSVTVYTKRLLRVIKMAAL